MALILSMLLSITVTADGGGGSAQKPMPDNDPAKLTSDAGFVAGGNPFGFRIGLGVCFNEPGVSYVGTDYGAKARAIQEYASHFYMTAQGETVIYPVDGSSGGSLTQYNGNPAVLAGGNVPGCTYVLQGTATGNVAAANGFLVSVDGHLSIPPDEAVVTQLMNELASLGDINKSLVERWKQEAYSTDLAKHPVVIVVEVVGFVTGDGTDSWWSAADWASRMGVGNQLLTTDISASNGYGSKSPASTTCNAIATMAGFGDGIDYNTGDSWPWRFCKRFFNCSYANRLHGPSVGNGYNNAASSAWQTLSEGGSELGINGCTVVSIGGDMSDIGGSYTWHINASRLPANAQGYQEDNVADAEGEKKIAVGAVSIKQYNQQQWREWIMDHNKGGTFTVEIEKYWVVGGNFSVNYEEVVNKRISNSTNSLSSGATKVTHPMNGDTLYKYICSDTETLDINGFTGGTLDTLGGSPLGDQYRVSYATTCKIVAPNGDEIPLANSQTHFAIYGDDTDKTYKFDQILQQGKSQVKQGDTGLDSEDYEAMAGTPTTKDLFITQGGEQWLVKLQYRYVDETYVRKYQLKSGDGKPTYHNFMYYKTNDSSGSVLAGNASISAVAHTKEYHACADCDNHLKDTQKDTTSQTACSSGLTAFKTAVSTFIQSIDNNWDTETDYTSKYDTLYPNKDKGGEVAQCLADINALSSGDANKDTSTMFERTVTLAEADDLDSDADSPTQVTFKFWQSTSNPKSHTEDKECVSSSCKTHKNGSDACDEQTYHILYSESFHSNWYYSITVNRGDWSPTEKILRYDDTLKQQYENTRYLDIVECNTWRMEGGKQVGMQPILAEPTEAVLSATCEKMGYCYYDSTQTNARDWLKSKKLWTTEEANDLNETGRLLNSYNKKTVKITLPDGSPVKIVKDKDTFLVEYSMENGGRSHHSYEAYFARVAGNMFYDNSGKPYTNYIFCSSDVFNVNTGNAGMNGPETFCFYQFCTEDVKNVEGLEQYIMKNEETLYKQFRNKTFKKNDHSSETPEAKGSAGGFQNAAHLHGVVALSKMDSDGKYAKTYNKKYMAEDNPYTFYKVIPNLKGITWVGYRGDYLTTSASHIPELKCVSDWTPDMSSAIMKEVWYGYTWLTDEAQNKNAMDEVASMGSEFPHKEGLNVNRKQQNNIYKTGYAAIHYAKTTSIDHTQLAGTLPLGLAYNGANIGVQSPQINNKAPGCAIKATYDDNWDTPNDIVIFNPSTAEDATVRELTQYMPDLNENVQSTDGSVNPIRDQRINGYYVGTSYKSPIFTEDDSVTSDTTNLPTAKVKEPREKSEMPTSYYDVDKDYTYTEESQTLYAQIAASGSWTVPDTADYMLQVYDSSGMCTAIRVHLQAGEKIKNVGGTLYRVANDAVVTWDDYITGHNTDYDVENPYQITDTRIDSYFLSELSKVRAGDVLHLRYKFEDEYAPTTKPFDVNIVVDDSTAVDSKYMYTENGHTWDYYVEFRKACTIERINVEFNINTKLDKLDYGEYMFEFVNSMVMSTGNTYSDPASATNTIDFVYLNNVVCAYNENIASFVHSDYTPTLMEPYTCYISYDRTIPQYVIKDTSANNPHIVYNKNWKYYTMGMKTNTGVTIVSPKDPLLDIDDTVLVWNDRTRDTITVGELRRSACLVKYGGCVYLTTKEAGREHKILQAGIEVSVYDRFTLAQTPAGLTFLSISSGERSYPLQAGKQGKCFQDGIYEFFFDLSGGAGANGYLFDVAYSKNPLYRFDKDANGTPIDSTSSFEYNWEYDWVMKEKTLTNDALGVQVVRRGIDSTYLSLDDKFVVHYSNIGNYYETDHHNEGSTNVDLGYGWRKELDTITWIEEKYVRFAFDVYTFGYNNQDGQADPSVTYQEYLSGTLQSDKHRDGTSINLMYWPAGTKIPLGYYEGDSGPADNEGHFFDYGKDTGYDYEFWVCLSSNEGKDRECRLNSVNINNNLDPETNPVNTNKDSLPMSYFRYSNAMHKHFEDIVGRVGNLTMLDTGDYRFSDTFKTTKSNADWLVYGLIKKLSSYSNIYGRPSTQGKLLVDPWDVRGRLSLDLSELARNAGYARYPVENQASPGGTRGGYSTYNTQWHKTGDPSTRIVSLPLTSKFNDHEALQLTQQKLGYANLLTLDSIGNYSGSNGQFCPPQEEQEHDSGPVNNNGDWGDSKLQVRPYYIAIKVNRDNHSVVDSYPVDVYMHTTDGYQKINSGDTSAKQSLATLLNNGFHYYLQNNTEGEDEKEQTYKLDQNMLRRMVTTEEAKITYDVVKARDNKDGTRFMSMLTNPTDLKGHEWDATSEYCYGNGQYLFLRARNRTFVGAEAEALRYNRSSNANEVDMVKYKEHAQMWYFDLGLPSSAVFVDSREDFDLSKIVKDDDTYILSCIDVYALGEAWDLHYSSPVSLQDIVIDDIPMDYTTWNPVYDKLPKLIPVTFYNSGETTAKEDLTTEGTH